MLNLEPPAPKNYNDWSIRFQCISGREPIDDFGRSPARNTVVRRLPFPPHLPGTTAIRGTFNLYGNADMGYEVRLRGRFPSKEQAVYVVQKVLDPTPERDYWAGVAVEPPTIGVHAKSIFHQYADIPVLTPAQIESNPDPYVSLIPEEEKSLAALLVMAASKRHLADAPFVDPLEAMLR